jgi:hypothetical protein
MSLSKHFESNVDGEARAQLAQIVTVEAFTVATLQNGWTHNVADQMSVKYLKDALGYVTMRGAAIAGTIPGIITNLPANYRPAIETRFGGITNAGTVVQLCVYANGNIILWSGPAGVEVTFNAIRFLAGR